jgi:hypothetical protein
VAALDRNRWQLSPEYAVTVKANNKDDSSILNERIEGLTKKTPDLNELHFDGGYGSVENDRLFDKYNITPIQTGVRGPSAAVDIRIEQKSSNEYLVTCPYQSVLSIPTLTKNKALFDKEICKGCSVAHKCLSQIFKYHSIYYFSHDYYIRKCRHEMIKTIPKERRKIRCNVEASVQEFVRRTKNGKLKVRGRFQTAVFAYTTAISVNFGRIYRHTIKNLPKPTPNSPKNRNVKELFNNYKNFVLLRIFQIIFTNKQLVSSIAFKA